MTELTPKPNRNLEEKVQEIKETQEKLDELNTEKEKPKLEPGEIQEVKQDKSDETVEIKQEKVTLCDMAEDGYMFFTTALLMTHGLMDVDPLIEYRKYEPKLSDADAPFAIDCDYPFFDGLGFGLLGREFVNWNNRIYGIHRQYWKSMHNFLCGLILYKQDIYHYAKVGWHELIICDPTTLHSGRVLRQLPALRITVFLVSGYRGIASIAPAKDPPRTLPCLRLDKPDPVVQKEAEALLGPPVNPEQFIQHRLEQPFVPTKDV